MRDPDGSNEKQLTFVTQFAQYPAWSPDGNLLAYVDFISTEGRYVIFVKDVRHLLSGPYANNIPPAAPVMIDRKQYLSYNFG
jgi:Tol biopolymer transport system component